MNSSQTESWVLDLYPDLSQVAQRARWRCDTIKVKTLIVLLSGIVGWKYQWQQGVLNGKRHFYQYLPQVRLDHNSAQLTSRVFLTRKEKEMAECRPIGNRNPCVRTCKNLVKVNKPDFLKLNPVRRVVLGIRNDDAGV